MLKRLNLQTITYLVISYMLLAFLWWTALLFTKNNDAFRAKAELLKLGLFAQKEVVSEVEFLQNSRYLALKKQYDRQEIMITGEAAVFIASLIFGIAMIRNGYRKQVEAAQQSRNFLLSITHELKSPLASIRLTLETFLKRDLFKSQVDHLSKTGLKETDRLTTLVNDLLLAARVENSYIPHPESMDARQLVIESVSQLSDKHPKANFEFDTKDKPIDLYADKSGLLSVVQNLLENAIKYSPNNADVSIMLTEDAEKVYLSVGDKGIGIPDWEKKKVFDKFYRVGSEDTRETKGTGLGLYIVNEIVKLHKGKIEINDNNPQGTVFKVILPKVYV